VNTSAQNISLHPKPTPEPDPIFDGHMDRVQRRLTAALTDPSVVLFRTDATGLFAAYLSAFPVDIRQHYNCNACRRFIDSFGGLVTIDDSGKTSSPLWDPADAPELYAAPVRAVLEVVDHAEVVGVFFAADRQLGTPLAGGWTHCAVRLPDYYPRLHAVTLTPGQAQAEKREDLANVARAVEEFSPEAIHQAIRVLKSEALYRSEKLLGAAEWLAGVQAVRRETKNKRARHNLSWRAVARAPAGFCHPWSGMLGTLLADIEAGLSFDEIKRRFDEKMHPLQYQRPQAAPTAGAIEQAEKLVEKMGIAPSLRRRFARVDEVEALWRPREDTKNAPPTGSVFGHLAPKGRSKARPLVVPAQAITWDKFRRTILPGADRIAFLIPHRNASYSAYTTAADMDAPPILQWDSADRRNPVAWYVYHGGSTASHFGLTAGEMVQVTAVTLQPTHWSGGGNAHHGESVLFCLAGCRDTVNRGGLALFPECMRSELHGVRSVIEAHSRSGRIEETEGDHASGIRFQKGDRQSLTLHVTSHGDVSTFDLDRWD
jgi:hypothetical protein